MVRLPNVSRRFLFALMSAAAVFFTATSARAAVFDPSLHWQTIQTEHFRVHHPERIGEIAKRTASLLEELYPQVTEKWNWKPWNRTEVILVDNTDDSNGLSSVLPYNWMLIYAVPPQPDSPLAHYNDWLRTLLAHEFTHIVQIDACGGIWRVFSVFLGKTASPSGVNPTWIREGVAQYDETFFTNGGRGRGSYSEMVVRSAVLDGAFPPIDEADGSSWRWPGFRSAYVYGLKFIDWLVETYGEDKFMEFDRRVRSSIMLTMVNHQARNVYGKTFYELWREWHQVLTKKYEGQRASIAAAGLTEPEVIVPNERDEQLSAPTLSRDGEKLVFTVASPHTKPEIRMQDIATGEKWSLKKGQEATQFSWSPDGTKIAYAAMNSYKRYNRYFDLWLYDFDVDKEKKRAKRLTRGLRARDPDFDPAGGSLVFVVGNGRDDALKRMDIGSGNITTITPQVAPYTQFAEPRVSPDGRHIAVSVWRPDYGWRIWRYNADGTNPVRLTKGMGLVIEARPAWTPDGRFIMFSSDEGGISNIYRVPSGGGASERVTNVLTGVFQPATAPGGVIAQHYTSKGFEIARFAVSPSPEEKGKGRSRGRKGRKGAVHSFPSPLMGEGQGEGEAVKLGHPPLNPLPSREGKKSIVTQSAKGEEGAVEEDSGSAPVSEDFKSKKYVAFGKSLFLPRFVVPNAAYTGNYFFFSLTTGAADPLRWHNWFASGNYRTDAKFFGYGLQYFYNRYRPIFGAAFNDYAVDFGYLAPTLHFFEHRRGANAFFAIPIQRHRLSLAYFFEDHMPKTSISAPVQSFLNLGHFAGFQADYRYGDAEKYPASISLENGRFIRLTANVTNHIFGSAYKNEQIIFSGDWREYVRLWHHHVLALRSTGGITWGKPLVQGTFGLGGALGEGAFGGGGAYNYFPLRGLPVSAFSRTRAMLFSSEYRFPILDPLRGLGTVPVFLKDISGAVFADYGNAWNAHENGSDSLRHFFGQFMLGVGAELRGDFIVGHGLPLHGRVGYAVVVLNRDRLGTLTDPILGDSIKNGMLVLTFGTSF
ncbi:MAG: hypothetical protein V2A66_01310 [Pseudomonadota bacterium]